MANIDTDTLQKLTEALTSTERLQDGAALAGTGLLLPLASLRAHAARRELARVQVREGNRSEAAQRQAALAAALAARAGEVADHFGRRTGPQAEIGEGEAALAGRVTRSGTAMTDVQVVALDGKGKALVRTCSGRDGRYALALPADTDIWLEVRDDGKPCYRDKQPGAYPPAYRGVRDIEIGDAEPVCATDEAAGPTGPGGSSGPGAPGAGPAPGPQALQMPDLQGLPLERAARAVEALGLHLGKLSEERSDHPGIVLAQQPEAGAKVRPDSEVGLVVGRDDSRPAANVGALCGNTLNEALKAMAEREVGLASVTIHPGKSRTPSVREQRVAESGDALHLDVVVGGGAAAEVEVAATVLGASPEGLALGLDSAAEAGRWLAKAHIDSLAVLAEAAGEDDAALRRRLSLEPRAKVSGIRRALVATVGRITRT